MFEKTVKHRANDASNDVIAHPYGGGGGDSVQFTDFANFARVHDLPLASFRCERIKGKPIFGFRTFLPSPKKVWAFQRVS